MTEYVAGFLFTKSRDKVALIRKNRPKWQSGKWNAIGGHIEETDDCPLFTMRREFKEETGLAVNDWEYFATLAGKDWRVHFYRAFESPDVVDKVNTMTDEIVDIWPLFFLPTSLMSNLRWLIEMALSVKQPTLMITEL